MRAKGKASVRVADILNRMQAEEPVNSSDVMMSNLLPMMNLSLISKFCNLCHFFFVGFLQLVVPEISTLILLDREVTSFITLYCLSGAKSY